MKKAYIPLLVLFYSTAYAEPFSYLKKETVDEMRGVGNKSSMNIHYDPKLVQHIARRRGDFPKDHPFYIGPEEFGENDLVVGIFDLTGEGDKFYVAYSSGPSFDVSYFLYKEDRVNEAINTKIKLGYRSDAGISALSIVIPGNGNVYSYGHNNSMADIKGKYKFENGKLKLLPQPFSYSGRKTKSLKEMMAYTDETLGEELFRITKNYPVTVVGVKYQTSTTSGKDLYLIASEYGLVGWVPVEAAQKETQFEGFYFAGD